MRNKFLHLAVLLISLAILIPAQAKPKKDKQPPADEGTVIVSVSTSDQTIVIKQKTKKDPVTYQVPFGTTITIEGTTATLDQLHAGMHIVTYSEADEHTLAQIDVSTKAGK